MERERQTGERRRLVLVPCPYQGHISPMLQLGTFLHNNGFSITVAHTRFNSPERSGHPDFRFVCLEDGVSKDQVFPADIIAGLLDFNVNCRASLEEELRKMMAGEGDAEDSGEVAGVIHDELMFFSEEVANDLKLRSFVLRTTSAAASFARLALVRLNEEGYFPLKESMFQEAVPQLHPLRFKDLPFWITAGLTHYSTMVKRMYKIGTPTAIIWNTMECLEKSSFVEIRNNCSVPVYPIGPLHKIASSASTSFLKEDTKCLAWLDQQPSNSVIYVSLGSIALVTEEEVEEMAWGLASSHQPFLWVIRPGSVRGSDWFEFVKSEFRDRVGDRGCIVEWAPQKEVLKHRAVGGFWSHCGWNSTVESLSEGVPMLCRPYFGDQRVNARYISYVWRVGLELGSGLEREEIERRIRKLMVEEEGRKMRERAMGFKEKIEASVGKDGSSSCNLKELVDLIKSF